MQNQHNTITNNAKSHIQRNKLLVRSQGAITRQVANSITRKTTPPIKIKGAWGPSTTTPSRTREATERGPGGGCLLPRWGRTPLAQGWISEFYWFAGLHLYPPYPREGGWQHAPYLESLKFLPVCMARLPGTVRQLLKARQKRKRINEVPWPVG